MRRVCRKFKETRAGRRCARFGGSVKKIVQHLRAQNDPNGNPQRLFVIYNPLTGAVEEVIDEGYGGQPRKTREMIRLPDIDISRSDYHEWLKSKWLKNKAKSA